MTTPPPGANDGKLLKWVGIGCGIPIALVVIVIIVSLAWPKDTGLRAGDAIVACENAVRDQLKSPSTASFDSSVLGNNPWTVNGTVDAQNSFGATVRADYRCTVTGTHAVIDSFQQR